MDELMVFSEFEREYFLSRHKPDGTAIGAPRKVYVPFFSDARAWFLPQSERAVLFNDGSVYFVAPGKPSNWIRQADLTPLTGETGHSEFLGVADGSSNDPKAIVQVKDDVYAVNEEGTYFTVSSAGWTAAKKPEPFYRIKAPSSQLGLVGVFPSPDRGDEFLVVHTRKKAIRELSREEILQAAERFLKPREIEWQRQHRPPTLEGRNRQRDEAMAEERKKRHVTKQVTTIDEWKHYLPESYAAVAVANERAFYGTLENHLTDPVELGVRPGRFRNEQEYWPWFKGLEVASETSFRLVRRGAAVETFTIPGYYSFELADLPQPGVEYRIHGDDLTVVLWMIGRDTQGTDEPGFYLVRAKERL